MKEIAFSGHPLFPPVKLIGTSRFYAKFPDGCEEPINAICVGGGMTMQEALLKLMAEIGAQSIILREEAPVTAE